MKNCVYKNGVYIYAEKKLHDPVAWEGESGAVVIVFGSDALEICPEQIDNASWAQAMRFAEEKGGNLPTRLQRLIMREYHNGIQYAFKKTGGVQLFDFTGVEWLCGECNSSYGWAYSGSIGTMNASGKYNGYSGRPVLAFSFNQLDN